MNDCEVSMRWIIKVSSIQQVHYHHHHNSDGRKLCAGSEKRSEITRRSDPRLFYKVEAERQDTRFLQVAVGRKRRGVDQLEAEKRDN